MTTTDLTPPPEQPAALMRDLLHAATVHMARATTPGVAEEEFRANTLVAAYAGAAARLLHALADGHSVDSVEEVADQLAEWLNFGEPLAEWVAEQAAQHGIDVDAVAEVGEQPATPAEAVEPDGVPVDRSGYEVTVVAAENVDRADSGRRVDAEVLAATPMGLAYELATLACEYHLVAAKQAIADSDDRPLSSVPPGTEADHG